MAEKIKKIHLHAQSAVSMSVAESGSYVFKACTSETNTVCKCQGNFVARDTVDFSTCKCNPGYGLKYNGNENGKHHTATQSARDLFYIFLVEKMSVSSFLLLRLLEM